MAQTKTALAHEGNVSDKVINKVAEAEDVDPLELTPPLYDVIDPDALDLVFATTPTAGRMEGTVTFSYNGYDVTVWGDGDVSVKK